MSASVRPAAVAGIWYPGTAEAIVREVDRYLAAVPPIRLAGRLVALVSPHAGLRYSGPVAAHGYSLLCGQVTPTIVLVGPAHRVAFEGVASCGSAAWETPLGRAAVDRDLLAAIVAAASDLVREHPQAHRDEHSIEMQLPFLMRLLPGLRIVPLLMGSQSREEVSGLAEALSRALAGRDALLVASSDLSHYQPARVANERDARVAKLVEEFDPEALSERLEAEENVACGGGPIVAVMRAARALGADRAAVLRYADSGDVEPHDKDHVVGYLSAALTARAS
jgi:hypothetical protein